MMVYGLGDLNLSKTKLRIFFKGKKTPNQRNITMNILHLTFEIYHSLSQPT